MGKPDLEETVADHESTLKQDIVASRRRVRNFFSRNKGAMVKYGIITAAAYTVPLVGLPLLAGKLAWDILGGENNWNYKHQEEITAVAAIAGLIGGMTIHVTAPTYDETPVDTGYPAVQEIRDSTGGAHMFPFLVDNDSYHLDGYLVTKDKSTCYFNTDHNTPFQNFHGRPEWMSDMIWYGEKSVIKSKGGMVFVKEPTMLKINEQTTTTYSEEEFTSTMAKAAKKCQATLVDYFKQK